MTNLHFKIHIYNDKQDIIKSFEYAGSDYSIASDFAKGEAKWRGCRVELAIYDINEVKCHSEFFEC